MRRRHPSPFLWPACRRSTTHRHDLVGTSGPPFDAVSYVINHPEFAWRAFGGNLTVGGNSITVTPSDSSRWRMYLAPVHLWRALDSGRFQTVALNARRGPRDALAFQRQRQRQRRRRACALISHRRYRGQLVRPRSPFWSRPKILTGTDRSSFRNRRPGGRPALALRPATFFLTELSGVTRLIGKAWSHPAREHLRSRRSSGTSAVGLPNPKPNKLCPHHRMTPARAGVAASTLPPDPADFAPVRSRTSRRWWPGFPYLTHRPDVLGWPADLFADARFPTDNDCRRALGGTTGRRRDFPGPVEAPSLSCAGERHDCRRRSLAPARAVVLHGLRPACSTPSAPVLAGLRPHPGRVAGWPEPFQQSENRISAS
jgi:hypothetical protein